MEVHLKRHCYGGCHGGALCMLFFGNSFCSTKWSYRKLIILMIFGYRMEAISILGREVMKPRGLAGLGYDCIDYSGNEIAQVRCALCKASLI